MRIVCNFAIPDFLSMHSNPWSTYHVFLVHLYCKYIFLNVFNYTLSYCIIRTELCIENLLQSTITTKNTQQLVTSMTDHFSTVQQTINVMGGFNVHAKVFFTNGSTLREYTHEHAHICCVVFLLPTECVGHALDF